MQSNCSGGAAGQIRGEMSEAAAIAAIHSKAISQANILSVCL
jgi:hypothetical protein